jgi:enolase
MKIDDIILKIVLDSRKQETLKATMKSGNIEVSSSVPQGKSKGEKEAYVLEPHSAIRRFEIIKNQIIDVEFSNLKEFDNYLLRIDGTENKSNLGGNLILVLSQTFCRLIAKSEGIELWQYLEKQLFVSSEKKAPYFESNEKQGSVDSRSAGPYFLFNLINGGKHAAYGPKIQEYMIVPQVDDPKVSLEVAQIFFAGLKEYFKKEYGENKFGDEGGLLISEDNYEKPLKILNQIKKELSLENKIKFSLDVAASSFYNKKEQIYLLEKDKSFSKEELGQVYKKLISQYDILSLEDPFEEKDWESFQKLTSEVGDKAIIIGDDLTVTNPKLLKKAIETKAITGVIVKPTQIGTISETLKTIDLANKYDLKIVISHRSAETDDHFIADLAWASKAWALKAGAPNQEERMVKYNRMIKIYEEDNFFRSN